MKRWPIWIIIFAITGILGLSATEQDVREAVLAANKAFQMRDTAAYSKLIADDFVRVLGGGRVLNRSAWLAAVERAGPARPTAKFDEEIIRVYGGGAIMSYRSYPQRPREDGTLPPPRRLTRILEQEGNRWVLVIAQSTLIAEVPDARESVAPGKTDAWTPVSAAEKAALETFRAIERANRERDVAAWERLSGPEHTIIRVNGNIMTRAERIAQLKAPSEQPAGRAADNQGIRIRIAGDLAVVTWLGRGGTSRSLKVLTKTNGRWRQVWQQATQIRNP